MLCLCLSLVALLYVFPHTLTAHNTQALCGLYWVCYAGQNHPQSCVCVCANGEISLLSACRARLATGTTFGRLCRAPNEVVVRRAGLSHFRALSLTSGIGLEVLWHSSPPAQTHIVTHPHTVEQTRTKSHTPPPLLPPCTYSQPDLP